MNGKTKISGTFQGEFPVEISIYQPEIKVLIPKREILPEILVQKFQKLRNSPIPINIDQIDVSNVKGESFSGHNIECTVIKANFASSSVNSSIIGEILDLSTDESFSILNLRPLDDKLTLNANEVLTDFNVKVFQNSGLFNRHLTVGLSFNLYSNIHSLHKLENGFEYYSKAPLDENIDYAIGLAQGVMPILRYSVIDNKLSISFKNDLIEKRIYTNSLLVDLQPEEFDPLDPEKINKIINNNYDKYLDNLKNLIDNMLTVFSTKTTDQLDSYRRSIEIHLEAKSNPTLINNKLLLEFTVIESLKGLLNIQSEKVDDILNSIQAIISSPENDDVNTLIRKLRNGLIHYVDPLAKLNAHDRFVFQSRFNSSISEVYDYISRSLDLFYKNFK